MTAPDIQQEIERTREHLGETVDELAARADVKARAREKVTEAKDRAAELSGRVRRSRLARRRWPLAVVAGVLVAGSAAIWWRRRS